MRSRRAKNILLVDDEPLVRMVLSRNLLSAGYNVIESSRGEGGLKLAQEKRCDAVVLDYRLPDMTGLEFCRRLSQTNGKIPVILASAYQLAPEELAQARALGIKGFIRKPFKSDLLLDKLAKALKGPRFSLLGNRFFTIDRPVDLHSRPLARKIFQKLFREGMDDGGHVHFYFQGFNDHVILLCQSGKVGKTIAKNETCEKGKYIRWEKSQLAAFDSDDILPRLASRVRLVEVDTVDYKLKWSTLYDFLCWLELGFGK